MGMFDNLKCKYPLPVKGANKKIYQTKDTPAQFLDLYEIRKDGTLWHEAYDTEDKSNPEAEGLARIVGMMTRVNQRWESVNFTGEICFYDFWEGEKGWIEFSAYFVNGKLNQLHLINNAADNL